MIATSAVKAAATVFPKGLRTLSLVEQRRKKRGVVGAETPGDGEYLLEAPERPVGSVVEEWVVASTLDVHDEGVGRGSRRVVVRTT